MFVFILSIVNLSIQILIRSIGFERYNILLLQYCLNYHLSLLSGENCTDTCQICLHFFIIMLLLLLLSLSISKHVLAWPSLFIILSPKPYLWEIVRVCQPSGTNQTNIVVEIPKHLHFSIVLVKYFIFIYILCPIAKAANGSSTSNVPFQIIIIIKNVNSAKYVFNGRGRILCPFHSFSLALPFVEFSFIYLTMTALIWIHIFQLARSYPITLYRCWLKVSIRFVPFRFVIK